MRPLFSFIPRPIRLAVFFAAVAVILYLTLAPNEDVPGSGMIWDKAAHSIAYGLLTLVGLFMSTHRRWMARARGRHCARWRMPNAIRN